MKHLVVVGLGNPGERYEKTRHNMGALVVKGMAVKMGLRLKEMRRCVARVARGMIGGTSVHLCMPQTYMNESGIAVKRYLDYTKLPPEALLIAVDDAALPFGQMRLRKEGSAGGHNGLKNITAHLGTDNYPRLRLGIGGAGPRSLEAHVLDRFSKEELEELTMFIERGIEVCFRLASDGIDQVMNAVNTKIKKEESNDK